MPISSERETLAPDLRSSFRRRLVSSAAAAAAAVAPDASVEMTLVSAENSMTESTCVDTSSDADSKCMIGNREEERKGETAMSGGGERGDGTGTVEGELPAKFVFRASAPAHRRVKESPLSSDAIFSQSHAGLFNLCIVVLVAVNSRLIIENLMKYGLLIRAGFWFSSRSLKDWPLLMCCLTLHCFPLAAFVVEKLAWNELVSGPVLLLLDVILVMSEISYPVFVIVRCDSAVLSGLALMLFASIIWLKLISYMHTNYDLRTLRHHIAKVQIRLIFSCQLVSSLA
ncbi:diacylglycerol O-acyltransferase 1 [Dendrobium catenatum]|uniref:diacylglycerol O-acyltransferase 1 n=1 Tax=Dendrobium catenatum TaxID=906689 RepID=UPI00109F31CF|nr:diacylglycerol O-acyltransferase 1 [Dendrobium catenatum]